MVECWKSLPALWVSATASLGGENVTAIHYKDAYREITGINTLQANILNLSACPNPVTDKCNIILPENWNDYTVRILDVTGKTILETRNTSSFDMSKWVAGNYLAIVSFSNQIGLVKITKI